MFRTIHSWNAQAWPYLYNTKLISSFSWLLQITYISSSAYMQVLSTNIKFIYATHLNQLNINVNSYYLSIDSRKLENYSYSFIYRFGHDGLNINLILSYHTLTQYMITITHYHWSLSITNSLTKQQNSPTHLHIRPNQENNKLIFSTPTQSQDYRYCLKHNSSSIINISSKTNFQYIYIFCQAYKISTLKFFLI